MSEDERKPENEEIESLSQGVLDAENMTPEELEEVSGGSITPALDDCGCNGVNCGTYA